MKGKKLLNISLISMLVFTMLVAFGPTVRAGVSQYTADAISVIPSSKIYSSDVYCTYLNTEFTVDITITNITDCAGYDFVVYYNSTLLKVTAITEQTDPANPMTPTQIAPDIPDRTLTNLTSHAAGRAGLSVIWAAGVDTYNGSGVAAEITFKIIYCPTQYPPAIPPDPPKDNTVSCDLAFDTTITKGYDYWGDDILIQAFNDGYYEYTTEGLVAGAPVADFTYSPKLPYVCDTVTCIDASTPNGGSINQWLWQISGPATMTSPADESTMTFHCDGPGTVAVTLTVWDTEQMSGSITKYIEQKEMIGCILDLYRSPIQFCGQTTTEVGEGENIPCDALSPDLNVTLFAAVSWNGKPVNHVLVAFEVVWFADPAGNPLQGGNQCVLYRTAETDKDGIARIWFRVPTPCEAMMFGKWYAYASAKIQEVKQEDWMYFDVGYLITLIDDVETFDPTGYPKDTFLAPCDTIFIKAHAKSISWMDKYVKFIVVVYDDCDVPIGQDIIGVTIDNTETTYCHATHHYIYYFEVHVPQWTYVGIGKIYVSAFTALPSDCGIPYCPEVSTTISLEWAGP